MVEITSELLQKLYKKYKPIIRKKIASYKILNTGLVEDIINEVFKIALEKDRLKNIREEHAIDYHFRKFWIYKGINQVLKNYFGNSGFLKESEIDDFDEKVNHRIDNGYIEDEARDFVIVDESLRKGVLTAHIQPKNNDIDWMDVVSGLLPEINDVDRYFVGKSIEYCLKELKEGKNTGSRERDFFILSDRLLIEKTQKQIAAKHKITPSRVNQIIKRDLAVLKRCLCEQLDLDKIWNYDCGELA